MSWPKFGNPELDLEVATLVFEIDMEERARLKFEEHALRNAGKGMTGDEQWPDDCPAWRQARFYRPDYYSSDIQLAWKVVERMEKSYFFATLIDKMALLSMNQADAAKYICECAVKTVKATEKSKQARERM